MRRILCLIVFLLLVSALVPAAAATENDCIYYFHGADCDHCAPAEAQIKELQIKYPELNIQKYEVYQNFKNARLLQQYFDAHAIPEKAQGIPAVFLPGSYLVGSTPIVNLLDGRIKENIDPSCPELDPAPWVGVVGEKAAHDVLKTLTFVGVTSSAVSDSFNPGMLALLLILLSLIALIKDEVTMIKRTVSFILASFFTYLLIGVGILARFTEPTAYVIFYKVIGIAALVVGIIRTRTFIQTWQIWRENVTGKTEKWLVNSRKYFISVWGVVLLGFFSSLLTSARLSKVFFIIQSLLVEGEFRAAAVPLMLYYSVLLVLPLIVIVSLLHLMRERQKDFAAKRTENFSSDVQRAKWKRHNHLIFQVVVNSLMMIVGLVLLFV